MTPQGNGRLQASRRTGGDWLHNRPGGPPPASRVPAERASEAPWRSRLAAKAPGPATSLRRAPALRTALHRPHLLPHVVHDAHEPRQQLGFFASRKFLLGFLLATLLHARGGHPLLALCGFAATVRPPHAAVGSTALVAERGELREHRGRTRRSQLGHSCKQRESQACALGPAGVGRSKEKGAGQCVTATRRPSNPLRRAVPQSERVVPRPDPSSPVCFFY